MKRKAVHFSLVSPLDQNPDRKCKPYFHVRSFHDSIYEIFMEAAKNRLTSSRQRTEVFTNAVAVDAAGYYALPTQLTIAS